MKKITGLLMVGFLLFTLFSCKKKQSIDITKFEKACQKVAQCDKSLPQVGNLEKHCVNLLVGREKKGESTESILRCIQDTECNQLSFVECAKEMIKDNIKELQSMVPGSHSQ